MMGDPKPFIAFWPDPADPYFYFSNDKTAKRIHCFKVALADMPDFMAVLKKNYESVEQRFNKAPIDG